MNGTDGGFDDSNLNDDLSNWRRDHIEQLLRVVIGFRRPTPAPIPINEFRDTRLEILYGVDGLTDTLMVHLDLGLQSIAVTTREEALAVHTADAAPVFKHRAELLLASLSNMWQNGFDDLLASKEGAWEDAERRFSAEEQAGLKSMFTTPAKQAVEAACAEFIAATAPEPTEDDKSEPAVIDTARSALAVERKAKVDAFLRKCRAEQPVIKFSKSLIWKYVGHKFPRQFQFWMAAHKKATASDNVNFTRVLSLNPEEFVRVLRLRQIL